MNEIELLAPAGSYDSLIAAVNTGADAVYVGGNKFSARAKASNFDNETLIKAMNHCHLYGVKVYIAVNTLIKDQELNEAIEYIEFLNNQGVDGVIIQDIGLFNEIKKTHHNFENLEIHASTQMTIHNLEGARFLNTIGYKRIVLSRELSIEEITEISQEIETEIFVHGALCICYSGQCLMSSLIGGKSGNRGRCAQPCRLKYTFISEDKSNKVIQKEGYILSPKDISTFDFVDKILATKTKSLKIEGRMKTPEYVAGVVSAYRKKIDNVDFSQLSEKQEKKNLLKLFNREGFSKAYFFGNQYKEMMAYNMPKNTGIILGKVVNGYIKLEDSISRGDGVRINNDGFSVSKIICDKKEVDRGNEEDIVKLYPIKYKNGDILYKTKDNELLNKLSYYYKEKYIRKIPLIVHVKFKPGEKLELYCLCDNEEFKVYGEEIQKAVKAPITKDRLNEILSKSHETPFYFQEIYYDIYEEGFMKISSINALRREIIEKIQDYRMKKNIISQVIKKTAVETQVVVLSENQDLKQSAKQYNMPKYLVVVTTKDQLNACRKFQDISIAIDPFSRNSDIEINAEINYILKVPNIIKQEFKEIEDLINYHIDKKNIKGILTGNLGIINVFKDKINIYGDYKLNILNKSALEFYNYYLNGAYVSLELNKQELDYITKQTNAGVLVYGRPELMVTEYCPIKSLFGCDHCKETHYLKDRMGEKSLVTTDKYCRTHIYNNIPINLIDNMKEMKNLKSFRLDFIDEDEKEVTEVLERLLNGENQKKKNTEKKYTKGHYKRGVE